MTVIVLGLCRLADVQYVSTVFDGARNYTIGGYLLVAYVLAWWHQYWMSAAAAIRFLDLVGGRGGADDARIEYPIDPSAVRTSVPAAGRVIQAHGAGRLLVLRAGGPITYFHSYSPTELADALGDGLPPRDPCRGDIDWVKWRLDSHFLLASAIVVLLFGVSGWALHQLPQEPHIPASSGPRVVPPLALSSVLFPADVCAEGRPIIALAASGGGTRAALYTASILERLHRERQLGSVRLVSGVSGGGAALAYFASHRPRLLGSDPAAWDEYFAAMKEPYIEDVLDGSGEWRIVSGSRLGRLLAESFERHWGNGRRTLAEVTDVGIVLNASIAGRFVREASDSQTDPIGLIERRSGRAGLSDVTGGRVIFTNLAVPDHLANPVLIEDEPERPRNDTRLPIFVVNGEHVSLFAAAAANANFPPVFSNVAIDRDRNLRLWVTDGGAVDNRGTETLLMTIRYALTEAPAECQTLPALHIAELEASAFSDGYRQDRGIGSRMAAGTAFASQLNAELLADIKRLYTARGQDAARLVRFHYLPMPALLRRSGSFGTHWMLQPRITVCRDPGCERAMTLSGDDVVALLRRLDQSPPALEPASVVDEAHEFVYDDDQKKLKQAWDRFITCLRSPKGIC
jgi:hypothetical protein